MHRGLVHIRHGPYKSRIEHYGLLMKSNMAFAAYRLSIPKFVAFALQLMEIELFQTQS